MVEFSRMILPNGLRVIVHEDRSTPLVAVNVLYYVGSRDERPNRTGFAHLFEHLMFAGSKHVPDFDEPLQCAGGENNAYTTNDYTTFYNIVPAQNLETVLWLESDRMFGLNITKKAFQVQRKVVIEEFKETCLNEPYGDAWHHLSDLMFSVHPYRWPVIGLTPEHLEDATVDDVREFYKHWYGPNNAVLAIAGNVNPAEAMILVEKWFGQIPARPFPERNLAQEPPQTGVPKREVRANVPVPAVYLAFRTPARLDPDFYTVDLLTDALAQGYSSRLYRHLVKDRPLFTQIDAYVTGNFDPGLLVVEGRPTPGISQEDAISAIWNELNFLKSEKIDERELEKMQHRLESSVVFSEMSALNKAQNLAVYEALCGAEWMNEELQAYLKVTPDDIQEVANKIFRPDNSCELTYINLPEKAQG